MMEIFFARAERNIQISLISSGDTKNQQFKELLIEIYSMFMMTEAVWSREWGCTSGDREKRRVVHR